MNNSDFDEDSEIYIEAKQETVAHNTEATEDTENTELTGFAETTPKQNEDWVIRSHQIVTKCFKLEGLGHGMAANFI